MCDDWNPGDVAKCIDDRFENLSDELNTPCTGPHPKLGGEYLVTGTEEELIQGHLLTGLFLSGFPGSDSWYEAHFIKVQPKGEDRKREESAPDRDAITAWKVQNYA